MWIVPVSAFRPWNRGGNGVAAVVVVGVVVGVVVLVVVGVVVRLVLGVRPVVELKCKN